MVPERVQSRQITLTGRCKHLKTRRLHIVYTPEQWEPSEYPQGRFPRFRRVFDAPLAKDSDCGLKSATVEFCRLSYCEFSSLSNDLCDHDFSWKAGSKVLECDRKRDSKNARIHSALLERAYGIIDLKV